jgi:hypothetical protein
MRSHFSDARFVWFTILGLALSPTAFAGGQEKPAAPQASTAAKAAPKAKKPIPRTPDGKPDLQGVWDFAQLTPFERPKELAGKATMTEEEAKAYAKSRINNENKDQREGGGSVDVERAYNDFWWDFGTRVARQTSLVVDPPDGRLPAMTPEALKKIAEFKNLYDNPEERPLAERCITGFNSGPPMVPSAYNNNMQVVQTKERVLIVNEMIHNARVVDLTGRQHPPASIKYLHGDSIGRWEGDTLVVETTNFARDGMFTSYTENKIVSSSMNMKLTERFSREDGQTLRYEFVIDDPSVFTKKFTVSIPMHASDELMFEYACHEANYGLEGVLKGARFQDKQPAKSTAK